jgi:hypothetical protein
MTDNDIVDPTTLPAVAPQMDITIVRAPDIVLAEARKAARALKDVIEAKPHKVMFNGEHYLCFEDWQTVGRFYGVTAKVVHTTPVEFGEVHGFEARAVAVRSDGAEISAAESMCCNDEPNWRSKPMFQLRSMAQTRAAAKALRNVLAWVVVLAGYNPTPAEEMTGTEQAAETKPSPPGTAPRATRPTGAPISEPQRKRLFGIAFSAGHAVEEVGAWLATQGFAPNGANVTRNVYDKLCTRVAIRTPLMPKAEAETAEAENPDELIPFEE